MNPMRSTVLTAVAVLLLAGATLNANTFLFGTTATVSTQPENAQANFTTVCPISNPTCTTTDLIVVSIINLERDPGSDVGSIHSIAFTVTSSTVPTGISVGTYAPANTITICGNGVKTCSAGTYTTGTQDPIGWAPNVPTTLSTSNLIGICDLAGQTGCGSTNGTDWSTGLIIGPPCVNTSTTTCANGNGTYSNPGSVASHSPLIFEEAQFELTITGSVFNIKSTTSPISNVSVSYGSQSGSKTLSPLFVYNGYETPEPGAFFLMATGVGLILVGKRRRRG